MSKRWMLIAPMLSLMVIACDRPQPVPRDDIPKEEEELSYVDGSDLPLDAFDGNVNTIQTEQDIALIQRIRQALVSDNSLSYGAKNISIRTRNGIVTLEGTVKSEREKYLIAGKIRQMYEVNAIENHLGVKNK